MSLDIHIDTLAAWMSDRIARHLHDKKVHVDGDLYELTTQVPLERVARELDCSSGAINGWIRSTHHLVTGESRKHVYGISVLYRQILGDNFSKNSVGPEEVAAVTGASIRYCGVVLRYGGIPRRVITPVGRYPTNEVRRAIINPTFLKALELKELREAYDEVQ